MSRAERQLSIGLGTWGVGHYQPQLWKDPRVSARASIDIGEYIRWAKLAEEARLDYFFLADSQFITPDSPPHELNRLEPFTALSALAVVTENIGLVATVSTSYNAPFNNARRLASLDQISNGRAGWNVVAGRDPGTAANFGVDAHYDHDTRYRMALEHVRVVQGLWDSYEDDAFPADLERGVFFDRTKLHALDHDGEFYRVAGPLSVSRSPQGQPVIFQAGGSAQGRDFASRVAEGAFTLVTSFEEGVAYYDDITSRAVAHGRSVDQVLVVPWLTPVVADTDADALELAHQNYLLDSDETFLLAQFGRDFGWHDFSRYELDERFPDLTGHAGVLAGPQARRIVAAAEDDGLTLRQTVRRFSGFETFRPPLFTGSATTVAAEVERWFSGHALDGMKVIFRTADDFAAFADGVLPILRERGLLRTEYRHSTLRENLGLAIPSNRHS